MQMDWKKAASGEGNYPLYEAGNYNVEIADWKKVKAKQSGNDMLDVSQLPPMETDSQEFRNLMDACKGRRMWWSLIQDTYNGTTKNKTAQRDPYAADPKNNKPFEPTSIEDVPEWVK